MEQCQTFYGLYLLYLTENTALRKLFFKSILKPENDSWFAINKKKSKTRSNVWVKNQQEDKIRV